MSLWERIVQWLQSHIHREKRELTERRNRLYTEHIQILKEIDQADRKRREQEARLRLLELEVQARQREDGH